MATLPLYIVMQSNDVQLLRVPERLQDHATKLLLTGGPWVINFMAYSLGACLHYNQIKDDY